MAEDTQELTRDIEVTRSDLTRNLDALTDKVSPGRVVERRVQRTKGGAARLKDRVMGTASTVKGSASGTAGSASSSVSDAAHGLAGSASGTKDSVVEHTEGNPIAAGVIAFGIGWLVSSLMPASEKEQHAAQALVDTAKEHGQPIVEQAKQAGQEVASNMQGKAADAAQSVKETAQQSASHVSEEAKGGAQSVAQDAKDAKDKASS